MVSEHWNMAKRLLDFVCIHLQYIFLSMSKEGMMIEPTETESETLDYFIDAMIQIANETRSR